jgi:hypothetical protein
MGLVGLGVLGLTWRWRHLLPLDPQLQSDIEEWLRIDATDVAAADEMRRRICADARKREEQRLSQLRDQAPLNRRAAVELRNRLREKLYLGDGLRRCIERSFGGTRDGAALLQALDREASATRQRWLEAKQFLE